MDQIRRRIVITGLIVSGLFIAAMLRSQLVMVMDAPKVTLSQAKIREVKAVVHAQGAVGSEKEAAVKSMVSGIVESVAAVEGKNVTKGDVLARVEDQKYRDDASEAAANLHLTMLELNAVRSEYMEKKQLYKNKAVSRKELLDTEIAYKRFLEQTLTIAQNRHKQAKKYLAATKISSPIKGTVVEVKLKPQDMAVEGKEMFVVADLKKPVARLFVNEFDLGKVKIGQKATIVLEGYPDQELSGRVRKIAGFVDKSEDIKRVEVICSISNSKRLPFKYGASLSAKITTGAKKEALSVPIGAIIAEGDKSWVYTTAFRRAKKTEVKPGLVGEDFVEILRGLVPGDKVITSGSLDVKHGDYIKVEKTEYEFIKNY